MIVVDVRHDNKVAIRALDQLSAAVKGAALARALNRAATTVRAEARRAIGARWMLSSATINKVLQIQRATSAKREAVVYAKDRRLPLASFSARTRKGGVVTVKVLRSGGRKVVKGNPNLEGAPFIQTMKSGHVGIFQRVSRNRLPIRELFTISIPRGLTDKVIAQTLRRVAVERFGVELAREIQFRSGKGA